MRKQLGATLVVLLALLCSPLRADNSQQEKMKKCNETATSKGLKGQERKDFMSTCLSAKAPAEPAKNMSQQDKMKKCNQEASDKGLKGDERKSFMSTCLSASPAK